MKNRIFILLGLLLVLSVFVLSCSQAGADDDALDKFEQMLEELSSEGDTSVAPEPVAERIYVIIPEDASAELCQKAKEFSENIASKTEIECSVKYDYEYTKRYDGDLLVLLGNTDDARSKDASANLRVGEYACRWDRGDIIIAAKDHTAAVSAADEFMSTVLTGASKYSLMSEGAGFEHTEEYEVSEVLINGYDLYDFSLVGSQDTIEMVYVLRDYIAKRSGYLLDVYLDGRQVEGKTISFGCDADVSGAVVEIEGRSLKVRAENGYMVSVAVGDIAERLFENISDGVASLDVSEAVRISSSNRSIKVCAVSYLNGGESNVYQIIDLVEKLNLNLFDIVVFGCMSETDFDDISQNFKSSEYSWNKVVGEDGSVFCSIYKKGMFESVSCNVSQGAFCVDMVAKGESEERRIIRAFDIDADALRALLNEYRSRDVVIIESEGCLADPLGVVGESEWSFCRKDYYLGVFTESSLSCTGYDFEISGSEYINAYSYFDISKTECDAFLELKKAFD